MIHETAVDAQTGRKFFLDYPSDLTPGEGVTFILSLHGGGSIGQWQRDYFRAYRLVDSHRLVIATPSAATAAPFRMWVGEADDEHLRNVVEQVFAKFGKQNIKSFWLAGHSQGGMTSNRLLATDYFRDRVDGWLSLSGGRIGPIELPDSFFGSRVGNLPVFPEILGQRPRPGAAVTPDADISYIFTSGEHEMTSLPTNSPWAQKYGAGQRRRLDDIVDELPGLVWDTTREGNSTAAWGFKAAPGTAQVFVYPNASGGKVIADIVRIDKGHTEGLEPNVTEAIIKLMVGAPGGKAKAL